MRTAASGTRMPRGNFQLSCAGASGLFASEHVRLRCLLLDLRTGRPRSMTDVSDILRLCEAIGSRFSMRGETRCSKALDGDPALKGFDIADSGVGNGVFTFGERRKSIALWGVLPPDVIEAGVINCGRLDLELKVRGAGESLLPKAGDFGGTSGGISMPSRMVVVSTFNEGFTLGLRMGESGLPIGAEASSLTVWMMSEDPGKMLCSEAKCDGPVTQDIRASPNGPALQLVPGALLDRS